jgi:hypothetical protein
MLAEMPHHPAAGDRANRRITASTTDIEENTA